MPTDAPIRYCVTIDTEEEWDWASGYPTGPASVRNIQHLAVFVERCLANNAAVVCFVNHAVLAKAESREVIQHLAQLPRVEIGLHIHPWNTPPLAHTDTVPVRDSYTHNLPWPVQQAKLDSVLAAFAEAGIQPTSYRGGRYSTSEQIQNYLRDQGLWVDCSVLPYTTWPDDGAPDFRQRGLAPLRHPPRHDGDKPVWELPLTLGTTRAPFETWLGLLKLADTQLGRLARFTGILDRLGIVSRAWLNFEHPLGERMLRFLDVLRQVRPPFVSFTLHSSSLLAGGSPYSRTAADVEKLHARADKALSLLQQWPEFQPATMTEIAEHLEAAHR